VELARAVNADVFLSHALINLGWVHLRLGDIDPARKQLNESLHTPSCSEVEEASRALEALAALASEAGNPEQGATMLGAAEGIRRSIGAPVFGTDRTSHEQTAKRLRALLGEATYRSAVDRGSLLTVDEVLKLAEAHESPANLSAHGPTSGATTPGV
jgi:hypothetical protein